MGKTSKRKLEAANAQKPDESPRRKIWLALPCYSGSVCVGTMRSLMHDIMPLIGIGYEIKIFDEIGHADIYMLRAQIVANFLADKDATDLVMIDNDVAWDANALGRLLDHPVDLVGGAYPKREYPIKFMFRSELDTGGPLMGDPSRGIIEVWGAAAGFMRMTRQMLQKMWDAYTDELGAYDRMVPGEKTVRMFDPYWWTDEQGRRRVLAEDYAFCQRYRDIGGKVYLDVGTAMAHVGNHAFHGQLGHWLDETLKKAPKDEAA